jgi:hypothetical protein
MEIPKITGYLLNSRNDGTYVFRVYNKDIGKSGCGYTDYELQVDDLKIDVHMDYAHLGEKNGVKYIRDGHPPEYYKKLISKLRKTKSNETMP